MIRSSPTVSYTHLDVYKRQLEDETDLAVAQRGTGVLVPRAHGDSVEVVFARGRRVEATETSRR